MAILLFAKKNFKGESIGVSADQPDIKATGLNGHPSSLQITTALDKALFFKQKDFDGACIFRRGKVDISDLGDKDEGGKLGFGNAIESVRLTPFSVDVNVIFIKNAASALPGQLTTESQARTLAQDTVARVSSLWEPFLLTMSLASVDFETDDRHFDVVLDRLVRFPLAFYKKNSVNVFLI